MHRCHRVVVEHGAPAALVAVSLCDPWQISFVWHSRPDLMVVSGRKAKSLKFLRRCHRMSTGLLKSATGNEYNRRASTHRGRIAWQREFPVSVALGSGTAAHQAEVEASVWAAAQHADHGMEL